ncbi:MAG: hypothetical protein J0G94_15860 [Sphingomonadales bacterium]|nr:hypothetical protein [Sphingomonadales bacterium]
MSRLLATLLEAAQGRAPVAVPRPHARFDQAGAAAGDIEWRTMRISEPAAEPVPPMSPAERPAPTSAPPSWAPADRSPEMRAAPLLPMADSRNMPAPAAASSPIGQGPDPAMPPPQPAEAVRAPKTQDGARLAPVAEPRFEPLLPPRQPAQDEAPAPASSTASPSGPDETILRGETGFTLRIGRIEVRAPAEAAGQTAPRPAVRSVTRPVALPRASVRQSLDDYRTSRKR